MPTIDNVFQIVLPPSPSAIDISVTENMSLDIADTVNLVIAIPAPTSTPDTPAIAVKFTGRAGVIKDLLLDAIAILHDFDADQLAALAFWEDEQELRLAMEEDDRDHSDPNW